ncbi:granzyme G-like isoform X2 [Astatotilapia calliptera]|uniref:granzyme G-like isoform X2 n=1 Tax=Astatotilapia calliptera TaxID=8154 RepID=UPI000E4263A9|nr:granzyme G-like isoform X2 [Astatotilapia calliptera]
MSVHFLALLVLVLTLEEQVYLGKITGGHEAVPHSRPYMVLLERNMSDGQKKYCGGFLLNEDFVMTAAHCHAKSYIVVVGLHNVRSSKETQRISVEETFPHEQFNPISFVNDVMLLKGDSGGPLVCEDGKAFGVVSSAVRPHSGGSDIYRYSKIPDSRNWIFFQPLEMP